MSGAFFDHNGLRLFYTTEGNGEPVLLLHGWTCDRLDWSFQIPFLTSMGFKCIALDARGHGRSELPNNDDYSLKTLSDDAAALLSHLNIESQIVMGHSLGALVACTMALNHPEKVKALVLVDPIYHLTGEQRADFAEMISKPNSPEIATMYFDRNSYTNATPEWMKGWHRHRVLGNPAHVVAGTVAQLFTDNSLGRRENAVRYIKELICPRLVTCMDEQKVLVEMEIGIDKDRDRVQCIPAGHWHHQQDFGTFNTVLKSWFEARGYMP